MSEKLHSNNCHSQNSILSFPRCNYSLGTRKKEKTPEVFNFFYECQLIFLKLLYFTDGEGDNRADNHGSRPMTPRRVKRRSVHSRGSMPYHSGTLPRPPHLRRQHDRTRSSRRHRPHHQNPVTRLIDHHQQLNHGEHLF